MQTLFAIENADKAFGTLPLEVKTGFGEVYSESTSGVVSAADEKEELKRAWRCLGEA